MLDGAMRTERVSAAEVLAAIRAQGGADLRNVHAVVLETNGNFSVITAPPERGGTALSSARQAGVAAAPEPEPEPRDRRRGGARSGPRTGAPGLSSLR